jgi:hypothetical protein
MWGALTILKVDVPRFILPCLTLKVRREGIEPPNPLIKRSQQDSGSHSGGGQTWTVVCGR